MAAGTCFPVWQAEAEFRNRPEARPGLTTQRIASVRHATSPSTAEWHTPCFSRVDGDETGQPDQPTCAVQALRCVHTDSGRAHVETLRRTSCRGPGSGLLR